MRETFERTAGADRAARRRDRRGGAAQRRARDLRLLRDRARRGVGEPGALRRRPLRAARGERRPDSRCTSAPARPASATRSSAGSCSAPTRSRRATTTPTTAAPSAFARRSPTTSAPRSRDFDFVVTPTSPSVAFELGASSTTRWRCTSTTTARCRCRSPGSPAISIPAGLAEPDGGGPSLPVGFQIAGPGVQRERDPRRRPRARAGDRLRRIAAGGGMSPIPDSWEAVIGLEIHVQLSTRTKMFCGCELSFGDEPNVHTCPVCLGHPGTLPVTNEQAVHYGLMIARRSSCEVAPRSIFHRKNYFYPDLPKGYQISQYDIPLAARRPARRRPHPPRPPRGGRREADPRRRVGPHPRRRRVARRLQPRRHAAGRDRHRARPAQRRRGARLGAAAAHDAASRSASPT